MKNQRAHYHSAIINVSLQKMKILCKEAFIIIHHGYFCRVSLCCTLACMSPVMEQSITCSEMSKSFLNLYPTLTPLVVYSSCTSSESYNIIAVGFHQQEGALGSNSQKLGSQRESEGHISVLVKDVEKGNNKTLQDPFKHRSLGNAGSISGKNWKTSSSSAELLWACSYRVSLGHHHTTFAGSISFSNHQLRAVDALLHI